MAGGGGTRFWPLSRNAMPKQLLNLSGRDRMVNETIRRLHTVVTPGDVFIVTNTEQTPAMLEATEGLVAADHILSEPSARNTAACVGYAAMEIRKKYGDGVMVITPSDAYIRNEPAFTAVLETAVRAAEEQDKLVTIGIEPTFPATGYGYIRAAASDAGAPVRLVESFREKPDAQTALEYLNDGGYSWNSGVFVWKVSTILDQFARLVPDIYADLVRIGDAMGTAQERAVIEAVYPGIRKISVDYAILEPAAAADSVLVVPGSFGWSDVGSWDMMNALHPEDAQGNILLGDVLCVDTADTTVYAGEKLVAAIGVENLVIVETGDAVLVCRKDRAQDVREIVAKLQAAGRTELL